MKRILYAFIALVLALFTLLTGCEAPLSLSEDLASNYLVYLGNGDFASAYSCLWPHGEIPTQEEFVESYTYFWDALKISGIKVEDSQVKEDANGNTTLTFSIFYESELAGDLPHTCTLRLVTDAGGVRIQYNSDLIYPDYTLGDVISTSTVYGNRGEVFTKDGVAIVQNGYSDTVYLDVPNVQDIQSTLSSLRTLLELDDEEAQKVLKDFQTAQEKNYGQVIVKVLPHGSVDDALEQTLLEIPGVAVDYTSLSPERLYPYKEVYAHITGYANAPDEERQQELAEEGYSKRSLAGKEGLEKSYDTQMLAKDGYKVQLYSSDGRFKSTIYEKPAENGQDVYLSIDSYTQNLAYWLLAENLTSEQTGVAIVMDPKTGQVEAMASYPSYDPAIFSFPISDEEYAALTDEDSNQPLYPRATYGLYPPGSTIKPFTAVPALENGVITPSTVFPDEIVNNSWHPKDEVWYWPDINRNEEPDGPLNLLNALRSSDNIFFAWLALEMGEDLFLDYYKSLGIGEAIPFDIPTAKSNLVNEGTEMDRKLLADMAFGHGELLVTPLQMASLYTAFQNDGDILQPRMVDGLFQMQDGVYTQTWQSERQVYKEDVVQSSTIDTLISCLKEVVNSGTARSIRIDGITLAAKTGTALKGENKTLESTWLVGWYQDMPEDKLVLVLIDGPRNAGTAAKFRIAKALLQPREVPEEPVSTTSPETSTSPKPDSPTPDTSSEPSPSPEPDSPESDNSPESSDLPDSSNTPTTSDSPEASAPQE